MIARTRHRLSAILLALCTTLACTAQTSAIDWPLTGGDSQNSHYSHLTQIDRTNVQKLQPAWTFETNEPGGLETTPIILDGVLYAFTPSQKVIALDGATGKLLWSFDSGIPGTGPDRGIVAWTSGPTHNPDHRLLCNITHFVYALDPATGKPIPTFGANGRIDLRENLGRDPALQSIALTSPGVVFRDLYIVGGRNPETLPAPPGDIRAYDVRTGALRWSFHTIPHPGEPGYETWPKDAWTTAGAANNWAGMALDQAHGIVYVPTGSAAPDFYGAARLGDDLYANTLLALDAATGKRLWHFQGVHHDLWDRDFPSAPILFTLTRDGAQIPAIGQTTKQGFFYLFNRLTGQPLFPIENRPASPSDISGEHASPTQPFPTLPAPFAPQTVTEANLTNRTPAAHVWAVARLKEIRHEAQFTPLSLARDTIVTPSFEGGAEWGGPAFDPETGLLYVNANTYASLGTLVENQGGSPGRKLYLAQCSACHGEHREGSEAFPSLLGITQRLTPAQIAGTIHQGRGRMPAFPIAGQPLADLLTYLGTAADPLSHPDELASTTPDPSRYTLTGYRRFNDPDGYPATAPPWGTLNALAPRTGQYRWQIPLGQYPELTTQGQPDTGTENYGGPIVTAGGLLFIAATNFDHKIRAFDKFTGKLLWQYTLPFAGNATPATYAIAGRQYLVIAAGGSSMNPRGPTGGTYIAFALPR